MPSPFPTFGKLQALDMKSVWKHEALDFTPWLCDHLGSLGAALGMDLELIEREANCGDFSLDVLARDLGSGGKVIIENQLTSTDHDHLGKLLTYAAGFEATAVVWIAQSFRDEHRQAIEWLNQRTDASTHFFGLTVKILRIDDSLPAFQFQTVVEPNEWQKTIAVPGKAPTERGEAYRRFFQALIDELRVKHSFTSAKVGQPQNWYTFASGSSGVTYGASFAADKRVRVELYIDRGSTNENKAIFDRLLEIRPQIEGDFGAALTWERLDGRRASRIATYFPGTIDLPESDLAAVRAEAVKRLLTLKATLSPHLSAVLASSGNCAAAAELESATGATSC